MVTVNLFRRVWLVLALSLMTSLNFAQKADSSQIASPSLEKTIRDNETASWELLKKKNYAAFGELLADNYVGIDNTGTTNRTDLLKSLADFHLLSYSMQDVKVMRVANDVALITYQVKLTGSYQGKELKRPIYAASVWVRHGAKWLQAFNQETEAQ
jgi:hypothetical protein